jgi:NhaP-type Na+/H+ or K+/H+ antiporter
MLFVFIPPLLFSECMNLNLHYVKKVFYSSILLAIPGAAFNAWLLAYYIYGSLDYNWNFTFCWIIGSILCATDPVSLVALMKSHVSTSSQMTLTYLVIGESLLNDGMALVLYEITSTEQSDKSMNRVA